MRRKRRRKRRDHVFQGIRHICITHPGSPGLQVLCASPGDSGGVTGCHLQAMGRAGVGSGRWASHQRMKGKGAAEPRSLPAEEWAQAEHSGGSTATGLLIR